MSFDIHLIPTDQSPTGDQIRVVVDQALVLCGARRGGNGECDIVGASGAEHEFFEGDDDAGSMFPLRGLSSEICHIVFEIADATRCFVVPVQEDIAFLRTPSNTAASPAGEDMPIVELPDPEALLAILTGGFAAWSNYRDGVTK